MLIGPKNWKDALQAVDQILFDQKMTRELVVCGGTALLVMNLIERETRDIDVICPDVDPGLKSIAAEVSKTLSLPEDWINNGPKSLENELLTDWEKRLELIFKGQALTIRALGRIDMIATKIYAFCDREDDYQDVLKLKPTAKELESVFEWVIERDASSYWPERVNSCFERLRRVLHGK
jgi:hypothetical protein